MSEEKKTFPGEEYNEEFYQQMKKEAEEQGMDIERLLKIMTLMDKWTCDGLEKDFPEVTMIEGTACLAMLLATKFKLNLDAMMDSPDEEFKELNISKEDVIKGRQKVYEASRLLLETFAQLEAELGDVGNIVVPFAATQYLAFSLMQKTIQEAS